MLFSYWHKLGEKYPFAQVDDFVVMPNHVHGIVVLEHQKGTLPDSTMPDMIGWFKTMTTNAYIRGIDGENWTPFEGKLWQRSFHDHIIRGEKDFLRIQQYIKDNPARWLEDKFYSM
jgi:REP element-mobilizing transposase RayT